MREKSVSESTHGLGGTRGRVGSRKFDRDCYRGEKSVCVKNRWENRCVTKVSG